MANASGATRVRFPVRLGPWTDWSRGRVMGATLTVRRTEGALLIEGGRCALLPRVPPPEMNDLASSLVSHNARFYTNAANYAQQCYTSDITTGTLDCTTYVKRSLPWAADGHAPCPFKGGICRSNTSNLLLDSGLIDSHEHLGLNAPPADRIQARVVSHCAPLVTAGYSRNISVRNYNYTRYYYGRYLQPDRPLAYTQQFNSQPSQYRVFDSFVGNLNSAFTLWSAQAAAFNISIGINQSDFDPIPELRVLDAEIFIIFLLGNGVVVGKPSSDPWYRATDPERRYGDYLTRQRTTAYRMQEAASPMGCVLRHQFCKTDVGCGPLAGAYEAYVLALSLFFNSTPDGGPLTPSVVRYNWFSNALFRATNVFAGIIGALQGVSLQSHERLMGGSLANIPEDQWQLDVTSWWTTTLAAVQANFVSAATGQVEPEAEKLAIPMNSYQREFCDIQVCHLMQ
ncbi:hypothetical protein OCS_06228 [Ophiocordyceps sinensis CO18]|uniref:Uncharacterized protein n=1 Tax=Ophiocordyceps sinensis (strain Co18 / CGMCC 3.14243) TaxID=911162 RepID=T5A6N0_OPHSC|nr:hypothetical protein OCS_06228 [Ophiocordyceps sinensis CO18]